MCGTEFELLFEPRCKAEAAGSYAQCECWDSGDSFHSQDTCRGLQRESRNGGGGGNELWKEREREEERERKGERINTKLTAKSQHDCIEMHPLSISCKQRIFEQQI